MDGSDRDSVPVYPQTTMGQTSAVPTDIEERNFPSQYQPNGPCNPVTLTNNADTTSQLQTVSLPHLPEVLDAIKNNRDPCWGQDAEDTRSDHADAEESTSSDAYVNTSYIGYGQQASLDPHSTTNPIQPCDLLSRTFNSQPAEATQPSILADETEVKHARSSKSNCSWLSLSNDPLEACIKNSYSGETCKFVLRGYCKHQLHSQAVIDLVKTVRDSGKYVMVTRRGTKVWNQTMGRLAYTVERTYASKSPLSDQLTEQIKRETMYLFDRLWEKDPRVAEGLLCMERVSRPWNSWGSLRDV